MPRGRETRTWRSPEPAEGEVIRDRAFELEECGAIRDAIECNELADRVRETNYALIASTAKLRFSAKV